MMGQHNRSVACNLLPLQHSPASQETKSLALTISPGVVASFCLAELGVPQECGPERDMSLADGGNAETVTATQTSEKHKHSHKPNKKIFSSHNIKPDRLAPGHVWCTLYT